ncbi:MAG: nodulation protein NfeD [bacterium]
MKKIIFVAALTAMLFITYLLPAVYAEKSSKIYILRVEGVIDPVIASYIKDGIAEAELNKAEALLIVMDTPGGLLDSTRKIISEMLNTELPVIVYVAPKGARAASAGVFITMASDLAAMAPLTHIGAAHPVSIGGGFPMPKPQEKQEESAKNDEGDEKVHNNQGSIMEEKVVSDASAYIENLAKEKGRNWQWAVKAVRESVSITAEEAKKENVIEYVVKSIDELLEVTEGTTVEKNEKSTTLKLKDALRIEFVMTAFKKFLHVIANPNIAYILLMLGFYGLVYEFSSPGIGLGAVFGTISLILAFYALQVLPVNYVGLILLILGLILMLLDLKIASHGILTLGGVVSFILGSFFLIDSSAKYLKISGGIIAGVAATTLIFVGFAVKKVVEAQRSKPVTGKEGLVGERGEVREELKPEGMVYVHGEYWNALSDEECEVGEQIEIVKVDHNKLIVKKVKS